MVTPTLSKNLSEVMYVSEPTRLTTEEFQDLYQRYSTPLIKFIRGYIKNFHDAEDIAQESFRRVAIHADTRKHVKNFLFQIARNLVTDFVRRKKVHFPVQTGLEELPERSVSPDMTILITEYEFSPEMNLTVQGYKGREIAEMLELTHPTVRRRLHHERKQLKEKGLI